MVTNGWIFNHIHMEAMSKSWDQKMVDTNWWILAFAFKLNSLGLLQTTKFVWVTCHKLWWCDRSVGHIIRGDDDHRISKWWLLMGKSWDQKMVGTNRWILAFAFKCSYINYKVVFTYQCFSYWCHGSVLGSENGGY